MVWRYLAIVAAFAVLFVPNAFAEESYSFEFQPGTIKFDTNLEDISCGDVIPQPEIGTATSFNIDGMDDHFFIFLSKTNSNTHHYLQIEIPDDKGKEERDSYLINFLKDGEAKSRQLYQGYGQMGVYLITDSEEKEVITKKYEQFLTGESLMISPHSLTYPPGQYDLHSILFQSDQTRFVDDEICAISLHWPVSVHSAGNITTEEPNYTIGRVYLSEETESDLDIDTKINNSITLEEKTSVKEQTEDTKSLTYSTGTVEWNESTSTIGDYGILKIEDPDMNVDPDRVDIFTAKAWSETDPDGITLDMVESGKNTSEFFIDIEFTDDKSDIQMLKVSQKDTVTAMYQDVTVPDDSMIEITDTIEITQNNIDSPLKQWKQGASPVEINCSKDMFLMINPDNQKPACLFVSSSMIRFAENGWVPVRNLVLDNPTVNKISGDGGEFAKRYFSYFEIKDYDSIIVHDINDKSLVNTIHSGDKIITNCVDTGSSEITLSTLVTVNAKDNNISMTHEKQTWPDGFCENDKSILNQYYSKFFTRDTNESKPEPKQNPQPADSQKLLSFLESGQVEEFNKLKASLILSSNPFLSLNGTNLQGLNLRGIDLTRVHIEGTNMQNANLQDIMIDYKNIKDVNLQGAELTGANLSDTWMYNVTFNDANIQNANLKNIHLENSNLDNANLMGADLRGVDFRFVSMIDTNFEDANMRGVNLSETILNNLNFQGANLQFANLMYATLSNANLKNTNLSNANLENTNLRDADLSGADLNGASLKNANLLDANFTNIKNLSISIEEVRQKGAIVN